MGGEIGAMRTTTPAPAPGRTCRRLRRSSDPGHGRCRAHRVGSIPPVSKFRPLSRRTAMAYAALDYYGIDELFTHDELLIRDTVRELVSTRIMPTIGKHWAAGTFPHELIPEFGKLGLLGPSLTGYGCAGISPSAYGLI